MAKKALFSGLIVDEQDNPVETKVIGNESFYVVDDLGFKRHIPSEEVDLKVLEHMQQLISGHEEIISEQAASMLGQDDIFSKAILKNQLENLDKSFHAILEAGIPEETRAYMGMLGFLIRINIHGEIIEIKQPGMSSHTDE